MEKDNIWTSWEGKKVFIKLKSGRNYSGLIKRVDVNPPLVWIVMLDKFNNIVQFSAMEIEVIEEVQE